MTDLRDVLRSLDALQPPDLWPAVLTRAATTDAARPRRWLPVVAAAATALAVLVPFLAVRDVDRGAQPAAPTSPPAAVPGSFSAEVVFVSPHVLGKADVQSTATFDYQDRTHWRLTRQDGPNVVADGRRVVTYDVVRGTTTDVPVTRAQPPGELLWLTSRTERGETCGPPVARPARDGRPVEARSCEGPLGGVDYVIDTHSRLVLEVRVGGSVVQQVRTVTHQPAFAPGAFGALGWQPAPTSAAATPPTAKPGQPLPDWELPRLRETGTVRSKEYRGRPVMVMFWATSCPDCTGRTGLAALAALGTQRPDLEVIAIATGQSRQEVEAWLAQHRAYMAVPLDAGGETASAWGAGTLPSFFLLDAQGRYLGSPPHGSTADDLVRFVDALLG